MKQVVTLIFTLMFLSGCLAEERTTPNHRGSLQTANNYYSVSRTSTERRLPELTETSTLSDYLSYAALNNPGLEASFDRWKAALERVPQVKALPDPRFNYKYYIEEVETRVGPQQQSFGISQVFPWFGKLQLRGEVAMQAANSARQRYEAAKLKLFFEVKDAYYEYYYLSKSIAITKENINLIRHLESVARSRYKAAITAHPDVIRAQVELGKLQDRYLTLQDLREPIMARLNDALNRPIDADIPWPDKIELENIKVEKGDLLKQLIEKNPELKALDFEIARNNSKIELAKKDYYPDFNLGLTMIDTDDSPVGNPNDNGKDPVIAMISINLPIWKDKYDASVREAKARYNAAKRDKIDKTNSLSSKLKMAIYRFNDAERKIDLYADALLPKARESLKVTESSFSTGSGSFTDLIDAQRIFLEFALSYERALADHGQGLAKLEMLTGQNISNKGNEKTGSNVQ